MKIFFIPIAELEEVKSTLARQRNGGKYVPLRLFRGERLSVSVTDVVSRMWCELSMEYRHLHRQLSKTQGWREREEELGRPVQRRTPVMTTGTNIHLAKGRCRHVPLYVCMYTCTRWVWVIVAKAYGFVTIIIIY